MTATTMTHMPLWVQALLGGRERAPSLDYYALVLRLGLGAVFIIGGMSKLNLLLDPAREAYILELYMGPKGYINTFFADYLFTGALGEVLTPWRFLTLLSTWEFLSGLALVAGWLVRPIALIYAFLLWTFVIALPVVTTPDVAVAVKTYQAPALLVQIRDVGLSGMMIVLFNLGAGARSVDRWIAGDTVNTPGAARWNHLGLLLRLSVAAPFIVGGFFAGLPNIQSFATVSWLLVGIGVLIAAGIQVRVLGMAAAAVMLWYMATKISMDASILANLNSFKREIAFVAAGLVLAHAGGGRLFAVPGLWRGHQTGDERPHGGTAST